MTSLSFFQFMTNLEQSGSRIPNAESAKLMCSLIVTFYPTKTENRTKKSLTQLSQYCYEYYFCQKMVIFCKKMLTSSRLRWPWYSKVYFLKLHKCVYLCTYVSNSWGGGVILPPSPTSKRTPKKPTPIRVKQKNDHTRIVCKTRFCSSFKLRFLNFNNKKDFFKIKFMPSVSTVLISVTWGSMARRKWLTASKEKVYF